MRTGPLVAREKRLKGSGMNDNDRLARTIGGGESKAQLIAKIKRLRANKNKAWERIDELEAGLAKALLLELRSSMNAEAAEAENEALRTRITELESQLAAKQSAPETPNYERSQLEALGTLRLVWVPGDNATVLMVGDTTAGLVVSPFEPGMLWTWQAPRNDGSVMWGFAATIDGAKSACEQYVRAQLEGKQ